MIKRLAVLLLFVGTVLLYSLSAGGAANDGKIEWKKINKYTYSYYSKVIYAKKFIALGAEGTVKISTDGLNWTSSYTGTGEALLNAVWANDRLVVTGTKGVVLTTRDFVNWTRKSLGADSIVSDIAWNGKKFVIVLKEFNTLKGYIYTSSDGVNWEKGDCSSISSLYRIVWNGSVFAAAGDDGKRGICAVSKDGEHWIEKPVGKNGQYLIGDISWNGKKFVAVGATYDTAQKPVILTSADGLSWGAAKIDVYSSFGIEALTDIIWGNGKFTALGYMGEIISSLDGQTWKLVDKSFKATYSSIAWGSKRYVAVGSEGAVKTSAEGQKWVKRDDDKSHMDLADIATDGKKFVCAANRKGGTGDLLISNDGMVWSESGVGGAKEFRMLQCIAWDGKQFVAAGLDGVVFITGKGNRRVDGTYRLSNNMIFSGNKYINLYESRTVLISSDDACKWTRCTEVQGTVNDIAYGGEEYVAVGATDLDYGLILYSRDGRQWTESGTTGARGFTCVTYGDGRFIAAGDAIYSSEDGVEWGKIAELPDKKGMTYWNYDREPFANDILWDGSRFIMVGNYGLMFTSKNAVDWTATGEGLTGDSLEKVAFNGNNYVAISESGTILCGKPAH